MDDAGALVAFDDVGMVYPNGTRALSHVSFAVRRGTCHALCGENGAGKSTLMKLLFGLEQPSAGRILVDGEPLVENSPRLAAIRGIGMVHQHFSLVPSLTVAESVALGREPMAGPLIDFSTARKVVRALGEQYGLTVDPDAVVGRLSVAAQQKVEILKALARDVRLLILDEPTAVLTPQETDELFERLRDLRAAGLTIVFISHKLREVRALASHVTVLRLGEVTGDAEIGELDDAAIARMVMGRVTLEVTKTPHSAGLPVLVATDLVRAAADAADRLDHVSFGIAAGEVLGVAGVEGNGQRGLVDVLSGAVRPDAGTLTLSGADALAGGTAGLRARGMAHLPSDRFADGGARSLSLVDNAIAGTFETAALGRWPFLSAARALDATNRMIRAFDVRCRGALQLLGGLSGGNAQKLIAARELGTQPTFLIADQPTRGIDIQAGAFIRARIAERAAAGAAVLLITADLDELLALSSRVMVLFAGRIVATYDNDGTLTPELLGPAMLGLHEKLAA